MRHPHGLEDASCIRDCLVVRGSAWYVDSDAMEHGESRENFGKLVYIPLRYHKRESQAVLISMLTGSSSGWIQIVEQAQGTPRQVFE